MAFIIIMVRIFIGTLLQIAKRISTPADDIEAYCWDVKDRRQAGPTVIPQGIFG